MCPFWRKKDHINLLLLLLHDKKMSKGISFVCNAHITYYAYNMYTIPHGHGIFERCSFFGGDCMPVWALQSTDWKCG